MDTTKSTDFKTNVAELTKIPPNEFEKYFQDWMERDDVTRSLQAKLRCDLIKSFNKTNLGKHILSHTMNSSGGAAMRLTLSPLILALNTLVAEFLYAQNCHFTLSVFCTEIPFRNTLPDFERMRKFRFNKDEIAEIWRAVMGFKANRTDLKKHIIEHYETNPNMSLLLLIIKYLIKKEPMEQLKRNVEVQTEVHEKTHKSIPFSDADLEKRSASKSNFKNNNNLFHINKYLLTLSEKVREMTREFELFTKQQRKSSTFNLKSSRTRDYYTLNKSLESITKNMKAMAQAESKNKYLANIIESIDNLTQQFDKCAQNFDNVTKFLSGKENMPESAQPARAKALVKEQQTETEFQAKSYTDWINEMRYTENGQTFLNRVEASLRKALAKHQEKLKTETDIKMKHLRSLMKLHYQQKLSKQLLQEPKENLEEAPKFNDDMGSKFKQLERKQLELLQKLQESSTELKEAQLQQKLCAEQSVHDEGRHKKDDNGTFEENIQHAEAGYPSIHSQNETGNNILLDDDNLKAKCKMDTLTKEIAVQSLSDGASNLQYKILDIARNIAEEGHSVDEIIYEAKLRIQQLENESNQLEQNFQSYLQRRKHNGKQINNNNEKSKIQIFLQDLHEIKTATLRPERQKRERFNKDEEMDKEELQRLREKLQQIDEAISSTRKTAKSDSSNSSLEIKNAILEAKLKFFEHENTLRKCREQEDEMHSGNLVQKHLEKYSELQQLDYYVSESNANFEIQSGAKETIELNAESSLSEINIKDKSLDEERDIDLSPLTDHTLQKSEERMPSASRELFAKDSKIETYNLQTSKFTKQNIAEGKFIKRPEITSELIKQSMAKMQFLFEQQTKSQDVLKEIVSEIQQEKEGLETTLNLTSRPNEALNKTLTSTITSVATETTEDTDINFPLQISSNRNFETSGRTLLNLSNLSEGSSESVHVVAGGQQQPIVIKEITGPERTSPCHEVEIGEVIEPFVSSQLQLSPTSDIKTTSKLIDFNWNDSNNKEKISEIATEPNREFSTVHDNVLENFSSQSSSDLQISAGQQDMDAKNLADSESDFWD